MASPAEKKSKFIANGGLSKLKVWQESGLSDTEIANEIGIQKSTLSKWKATDERIRNALSKSKRFGAPPKKLTDIEKLHDKIDEYFEKMDEEKRPYTKSGLSLYLNIDVDTLDKKAKEEPEPSGVFKENIFTGEKEELSVVGEIKRAFRKIQVQIDEKLLAGKQNVAGAIFYAKNTFGYTDKQEIGTINDKPFKIETEADIDKRIAELLAKEKL